MKQQIKFLAFAILTFVASACSDDEESVASNALTLNGTAYAINAAYTQSWQSGSGNATHAIVFTTEGVNVPNVESFSFVGDGKYVVLEFIRPGVTETSLQTGSFTEVYNSQIANVVNSVASNHSKDYETDGPFQVVRNGSTYTLTGKFKKGSDAFSVSYTGTLTGVYGWD